MALRIILHIVILIKSYTMSKVVIVPAESGALVRSYTNNPEFGYLVLESVEFTVGTGWVRETKRTALLRAKVAILTRFATNTNLPGRIQVQEFLEDSIPMDIAKANLRADLPFEEAISGFIKRAGKDGPALTRDGKRIVSFSSYDPAGQSVDITIAHDNGAEISASKSALGSASLPGGDNSPF
jgi:hypothetical protein